MFELIWNKRESFRGEELASGRRKVHFLAFASPAASWQPPTKPTLPTNKPTDQQGALSSPTRI